MALKTVPHYTTFQKAAQRLLVTGGVRRLLDETLTVAKENGRLGSRSKLAALGGTGWEAHHVSRYYVKRRANNGKTRHETNEIRGRTRNGMGVDSTARRLTPVDHDCEVRAGCSFSAST
jgi:hypothetical protein